MWAIFVVSTEGIKQVGAGEMLRHLLIWGDFLTLVTQEFRYSYPTMIKVIIFDWHGVLDRTQFEALTALLADFVYKEKEHVHQKLHLVERQYARGDIDAELFWHHVQQVLQLTSDQLERARAYILSIRLNTQLWAALKELAAKYTLAILSDCPMEKSAIIRHQVNLDLFKVSHFSAEDHLLKSEPAFFTNVLHELEAMPEECLFVDDREKNLVIPSQLGLNFHLFDEELSFLRSL
jgi:putative hydrolase of the HAD superfamily